MANAGISKLMRMLLSASEMCLRERGGGLQRASEREAQRAGEGRRTSSSVNDPTALTAPHLTSKLTPIACQKEKKRMPLTQRNLGVGRKGRTLDIPFPGEGLARGGGEGEGGSEGGEGRGTDSAWIVTQNMARQLGARRSGRRGGGERAGEREAGEGGQRCARPTARRRKRREQGGRTH